MLFRQLPQRVDEELDRRQRGRAPSEGFDGNGQQLGVAGCTMRRAVAWPAGEGEAGSYGNPQILVELGKRLTAPWRMRVRWGYCVHPMMRFSLR
ncbi:MAG: hypothetical protein ACRDR6_01405 [Pseudonocardiaceae bacterium]